MKIGNLPERVIDKGIPGAGLLALILTDKYLDHLPLYRQKQRFARENINIASSTISGLDAAATKDLRLEESLPVINGLGKWLFEEIKSTLPKSQIGKAMAYAYARWDALSAYLYDGNLCISLYARLCPICR